MDVIAPFPPRWIRSSPCSWPVPPAGFPRSPETRAEPVVPAFTAPHCSPVQRWGGAWDGEPLDLGPDLRGQL